jgi:hypothetical protein
MTVQLLLMSTGYDVILQALGGLWTEHSLAWLFIQDLYFKQNPKFEPEQKMYMRTCAIRRGGSAGAARSS